MSFDIVEGSYTHFNTSKYVEEVIQVDEFDKGKLSAAAREDTYSKAELSCAPLGLKLNYI